MFVPEEARAGGQVVRKAVTDRKINVNPSVKTYYIEMIPPTLHDPLGDYERVCDALKAQHGLDAPILDYRVLLGMPDTLRQSGWKVSVSVWTGGPVPEIVRIAPGTIERSIGLAVDVGTTSVAAYLCDLTTGEVINYDSMMNPQVPYGEDVMSRITYAMANDDGIHKLQAAIIEGVNTLAARVCEAVGFTHEDILELAIVFNTAMHHCFLGIYPEHLGLAPYAPALHHSINIKARDLGLKFAPGANVFVLPNEAGFVGADNVGVLIAEEPYNKDDRQLIIDIGTNGELIMGNREKLISASCATGPAFEGAQIHFGMRAAPGAIEKIYINPETKEPRFRVIGKEEWSDEMDPETIGAKGICGSGIIDGVAELFKAGIIDKTGKFVKGPRHPAGAEGRTGRRVRPSLGQGDFRGTGRHHDHQGRAGGAVGEGCHVRRRQDHDEQTRLRDSGPGGVGRRLRLLHRPGRVAHHRHVPRRACSQGLRCGERSRRRRSDGPARLHQARGSR